jgi:hypothetical protein
MQLTAPGTPMTMNVSGLMTADPRRTEGGSEHAPAKEEPAVRGAVAWIEWLMLLGYAVASALAVSVALVIAVLLTSSFTSAGDGAAERPAASAAERPAAGAASVPDNTR